MAGIDQKESGAKNRVKRYKFDLLQTAHQRWSVILSEYKAVLPRLKEHIEGVLQSVGVTDDSWSLWSAQKLVAMYKDKMLYRDELDVIAEMTGIPLEKLMIMQLLYEATAACSCVITSVKNATGTDTKDTGNNAATNVGEKVMMRTMDWDMPILKEITIELEFCMGDKVLFVAPTWIGCVGVFTAYLPDPNYGIAINYRRTQNLSLLKLVSNLWRVLGMKWPVSYLVRHVATKQYRYDMAQSILQRAELVSPAYITLFAPQDTCAVITRDTNKNTIRYEAKDGSLFQTNCDPVTLEPDILHSKARCELIRRELDKVGNQWKSLEDMQRAICVFPIHNHETVYTSIFARGGICTFV